MRGRRSDHAAGDGGAGQTTGRRGGQLPGRDGGRLEGERCSDREGGREGQEEAQLAASFVFHMFSAPLAVPSSLPAASGVVLLPLLGAGIYYPLRICRVFAPLAVPSRVQFAPPPPSASPTPCTENMQGEQEAASEGGREQETTGSRWAGEGGSGRKWQGEGGRGGTRGEKP